MLEVERTGKRKRTATESSRHGNNNGAVAGGPHDHISNNVR